MTIEQTLSIIKPDAVSKNVIGQILSRFEQNGLRIIAAKMQQLSRAQAEEFYAEHKERPFYGELVDFMISAPVMIQVLEGENAVSKNRELMGATMPRNAEPGSIRYDFAYNESNPDSADNAVHGSDSTESAAREIKFFFKSDEICKRPA
ncbi:MAG: nucleoside-diphosphate kinase [Gammaproteobacteria bacterium]